MDLHTDPTFAGLMLDILECPDDDTPRLILADYLDEYAEAEHDRIGAEVIRRQIADPEWQPWNKNDDLSDWHTDQTRWVRSLFCRPSCGMIEPKPGPSVIGPYVGIGIDRGFVGELSLSQQDWIDAGPAIVRMAPIRRVVIDDCVPHWSDDSPGKKAVLFRRLTPPVQRPHEVDNRIWPFLPDSASWTLHMNRYDTPEEAQDDLNQAALLWARHCDLADLTNARQFVASRLNNFTMREVSHAR